MKNLFSSLVFVALVLTAVACDKANLVSPTPVENPVGHSNPFPFQPVEMRFLDGAGNPGPLVLHLLELLPGPGAVRPNSIEFTAKICMDPILGRNSSYLSQMRLVSLQSDDGNTPRDQTDSAFDSDGTPFIVKQGECMTIKMPPPIPSRPGSYYQYVLQPGVNYLLFAAAYGPKWPSNSFINWGSLADKACPPIDVIERSKSTPPCILSAAYFLEYSQYHPNSIRP